MSDTDLTDLDLRMRQAKEDEGSPQVWRGHYARAWKGGCKQGRDWVITEALAVVESEKRYDETDTYPEDIYAGSGPPEEYVCNYGRLKARLEALRNEPQGDA